LPPRIGKVPYELFIEDIEGIIDKTQFADRFLVLGDFNGVLA
jgi:hypothetical protein